MIGALAHGQEPYAAAPLPRLPAGVAELFSFPYVSGKALPRGTAGGGVRIPCMKRADGRSGRRSPGRWPRWRRSPPGRWRRPAAKDAYLGYLAAPGGVTVNGSPYRYVAISPRTRHRQTVVERIDLAGGRVDRWWYLKGGWSIPAGSYHRGGTGLSADEGTLVLTAERERRLRRWPPVTRLAVLDTQVRLRTAAASRRGRDAPRDPADRLRAARYEVAALSPPDGSTAYLVQMLHPAPLRPTRSPPAARAEARAEDAFAGPRPRPRQRPLSPSPALSRDGAASAARRRADRPRLEPRRPLVLRPLHRQAKANSSCSRSTPPRRTRVARVDLPRLRFSHRPFGFQLRVSGDGRRLIVFRHDSQPPRPLGAAGDRAAADRRRAPNPTRSATGRSASSSGRSTPAT